MSQIAYLKHVFATLLVVTMVAAAHAESEAASSEAAPADEILLKNGSRILGKVTSVRDGKVTVETDFAGAVSVSMDQIVAMNTGAAATLLLADKSVIEQSGIQVQNSELVVDTGGAATRTYALDELLVVNPEPWELGKGYAWTGAVSFAFSMQRGNSDIDELDYRLNTSWRSKRDRFTLRLTGEVDEANDQKNAENWLASGKYDYFFSDSSFWDYWGVNLTVESDKFKDLDLRYLVGPYVGRDFYTDPLFTLSSEFGVSYVNEDYIKAPDQDNAAGNWFLRMTSNYLGGDSQLYLEQRGIWNFEDTSDVVIDTSLGLSFPLLFQLEAAAEILWEYDSAAVEGVDELDETYRLRIGYSW